MLLSWIFFLYHLFGILKLLILIQLKFQILHNLSKFFYIKIWNSFCNKKNESELYSKFESKSLLIWDVIFLVITLKDMFAHDPPLFLIFLRLQNETKKPKNFGEMYIELFSSKKYFLWITIVIMAWWKFEQYDCVQSIERRMKCRLELKGKETTLKNDKQ